MAIIDTEEHREFSELVLRWKCTCGQVAFEIDLHKEDEFEMECSSCKRIWTPDVEMKYRQH